MRIYVTCGCVRRVSFIIEHWRSTLGFTQSVTGDVWQMINEYEHLTRPFQFCLQQKIPDFEIT